MSTCEKLVFMKRAIHKLLFLLFVAASSVQAESQCLVSSDTHAEDAALPSCESLYPSARYGDDLSPWRVGISVGYGQRENPLVNGEDIPVYGGLQLSYFGEHVFFDNGDVGFFILSGKHWDVNAIAGLGSERVFFSSFNRTGFGFIGTVDAGAPEPPVVFPVPEPSEGAGERPVGSKRERPPKRSLTVDAGVEWLYYRNHVDVQVQVLTDASGRHNGQELWMSADYHIKRGNWRFSPGFGLTWESSQAANYFYGVRQYEVTSQRPAYKVGDAWSGLVRLNAAYRLNAHWNIVGLWQASVFDDSISDSPWVEKHVTQSFYLGVYYEF